MSNLVEHAKRELALIGGEDDEMQQLMNKNIIEMVEVFSKAGHSGFSAEHAIQTLEKLLRFENLTPLTDDPDEWNHVHETVWGAPNGVWQNRRNSEAFSEDGGKTYYLLSENVQDSHSIRKTIHQSKAVG
jgi:hypothetical protein